MVVNAPGRRLFVARSVLDVHAGSTYCGHMKDHTNGSAEPAQSKNVVGVRELKTHTAGILRHVREAQASYIVTHRGRAVGVILPIDEHVGISPAFGDSDPEAAWATFMRAGRRLERRFRPGVSGVALLSGMRR